MIQLSTSLLKEAYQKAKDLQMNEDFIQLLKVELEGREHEPGTQLEENK
ncbi:sporulation histidine kinase inhibitor Sda [Aquibacillus salsiterrae]|uniref:Sporulation histidine kinase inhibitor Sda n=1 Tax=Aquibacillus salsiterrae TaxID=2950439 RepID=A0A9X3WHN6_9BACI|nr:sporulation histidine kinase inhibitor Sda [Aquibacillus salsiterrae]MDC3417589.1 sporulation histidine kinase inhibitor Sda [Aquibacillus salsiterrae]